MELPFRQVWASDFEFEAPPGERQIPVCLVARELKSGQTIRLWQSDLGDRPPYDIGADSLFVSYSATAELSCHLALGWPMPARILDLFTEFRCQTNGLPLTSGWNLLGALTQFGLDSSGATEKKEMQEAIGNGAWRGRYTPQEITTYCERDVVAVERLLPKLLPKLDLGRALIRGRYMAALSRIVHAGIPIDVDMLNRMIAGWGDIRDRLIAEVDVDYGVYQGTTFKHDLFEALLGRLGIPWTRTASGRLELTDEAFEEGAAAHPILHPLRELRSSLGKLRLQGLEVGKDARARCWLNPFGTKTGRNAPSSKRFIFGPSKWIRGLIKPPVGYGIAYIDWSAQEFGIAAALSGDAAMMEAYSSGDPYLWLGKHSGAIPPDADKSHPRRDQLKVVALSAMYGAGEGRIAATLNEPVVFARDLIQQHKNAFPTFWRWIQACVDSANLTGVIRAVYGWQMHTRYNKPNTVFNYPMQGNGAEMMRIACMLGTEAGIEICAPVHDAVLIAAPLDRLDDDVARMREIMRVAGEKVLGGFKLRTSAEVVRYPDRYMDARGRVMWERVVRLLE